MRHGVRNRLRVKLFFLIIPLLFSVGAASGVLLLLESQKAIVRAANRHMAYKAEQLRDYSYNEWNVLEKLELASSGEYRSAAEKSFASYGYSLLRSKTEKIFIFDRTGSTHAVLSLLTAWNDSPRTAVRDDTSPIPTGWFSGTLDGERRVGVVFAFEPFDWTIAVTETRNAFFSDTKGFVLVQLAILVVALATVSLLITLYVGSVLGPVERLAETIERIALTHDMSHRATVECDDEIGFLAERFNNMISAIQLTQEQIQRTSLAESVSRKKALVGEIETLNLLGKISDFRDQKTGEHQSRISSLTRQFAFLLGQNEDQLELIANASKLHDIGKIAIPDNILLKPSKLTVEEFAVIKTHTTLGFELLRGSHSENLAEGAIIAYTHHERWDGNGYPQGLRGEQIPLSGRIVSVVDVFDALTSERPYKKGWAKDKALEYIVSQRGIQFDPDLVDVFTEHFEEFTALIQTD
jgi:response regulator RpfG family c-di-GMP phosphodiesterase